MSFLKRLLGLSSDKSGESTTDAAAKQSSPAEDPNTQQSAPAAAEGILPAYSPAHSLGVGRFYDEQYDAFDRVYGSVIQAYRTVDVHKLLDYQIASMGLEAGWRVLDAGCGVGAPALYFAQHTPISEVQGLTISEKQAQAGQQNVREAGLDKPVEIRQGDYHQLTDYYPAEHFDAIYFLESFGHSDNKAQLLDQCWRVLKPGGVVYIKDLFVREPLTPLGPEHAHKMAYELQRINDSYHYNVTDLYDFLRVLRRMGFILQYLKTIDLPLQEFENLTISNEFQELTGIMRIEDFSTYVFPVDFFELRLLKPHYELEKGLDRYFLQNLYYMQVHNRPAEEL